MMYDFISKEILNPEIYKERVEEFLSLLLRQNVKILEVLPNEETGLSDGYSILIMDIVVELENGSIVNLEIQKNGYMFPGERSACYSADLLQKYLFVALDNFRTIKHNENSKVVINNRLEAWLAFMCMDDPDDIVRIIENCPDFKEMYEQIYDICRNLDGVMRMFSKELQELDRNSVELMVDEMQKDLDKTRDELEDARKKMETKDKQIEMLKKELENMKHVQVEDQ